jgi:hypothetical protein
MVKMTTEAIEEAKDRNKEEEEILDQAQGVTERMDRLKDEIQAAWLDEKPIRDHESIAKEYAKRFNLNLTDAKKQLFTYPEKYEIQGNDIPKVIKEMRNFRRTLKGEKKLTFTKSIDTLIDAYSDYLNKCMDSIYWVKKYKVPLTQMNNSEYQLRKLHSVKGESDKRFFINTLCKYWEAELDRKQVTYGKEYAELSKQMNKNKKAFKKALKDRVIGKSPKVEIKREILKSVCENPGISSREIHDSLPRNLYDRSSPIVISKLAKEQNITNVDGAYYKINDDIKKNLWAYTAAFIDSDGYITMDKNHNPRVGLVATGNRGKAFMMEMHKSLGFGRLHLDQKSPQDTRPVNRLNFYSASDVKKLLTKCRPHFKMKGPNADVLLELIKIKKNDKKAEWYAQRKEELFKLMKYHNHSDNTRFDWKEWDIDINNINKLIDNSKMEE